MAAAAASRRTQAFGLDKQPGNDSQQGGFSSAVGTRDKQRISGGNRKIKAGKQPLPTSFSTQVFRD